MAGVAQRIVLAAPAGADRHHESVGFDDVAVGHLDSHRAGYQHRAVRVSPVPACAVMVCPPGSPPAPLPGSPRGIRPVLSSQLGPRRQHGSERNPLRGNDFGVQPGRTVKRSSEFSTPARADCTSSRDPPSAQQASAPTSHSGSSTSRPSGPAFQAHDGPALERDHFGVAGRRRGHIRRIGHDDVERRVVESASPRSLADVDVHAGVDGVAARTPHGVRADVERGHAGAAHFGRGDRDEAATRTQVENPPPRDRVALYASHRPAIANRLVAGRHRRCPAEISGCEDK